jgi:hypothetical protein
MLHVALLLKKLGYLERSHTKVGAGLSPRNPL